ncbi:hypothetical protein GGI43DRAFT_287329 [Trichoderma evansii]
MVLRQVWAALLHYTTTGYSVWDEAAFALPGNQPKAPLRTKYRDGTWLHKSGALWPLHVLLLCAPCPCICAHAAKCKVSRGGPGFNLKANAFTSLHLIPLMVRPSSSARLVSTSIIYTYIRSTARGAKAVEQVIAKADCWPWCESSCVPE